MSSTLARPLMAVAAACAAASVLPTQAGAARRADVPVEAAIVHGTPTTAAEWPFLVQIVLADSTLASMHCTGAVISPTWVITAAHCAADSVDQDGRVVAAEPTDFRIFAGGDQSFTGSARSVKRVIVHPDWQPELQWPDSDGDGEPDELSEITDQVLLDYLARLGANDVALLELTAPVSTPAVRIATSADAALVEPGDVATVLGWGSTTADDMPGISPVLPATPRRATLRLLDPHAVGVTASGLLAVFARGTDQGVCHGDSGGPLVVAGTDGQLRLAGVTSSGLACAPSEPTGAQFGNVAAVSSWISQYVNDRPATGAAVPASFGIEGERATAIDGVELGGFQAVSPFRLLDSRAAGLDEDGEPISEGQVLARGIGPIPASARGLLVTVTSISEEDYEERAVAGACDTEDEFWTGFDGDVGPVAWTTVMPLGASGTVCWYGDPHHVIVVDVLGWFGPEANGVFSPAPARLVDTRTTATVVDPATPLVVRVHGGGSAVLNVTAIGQRRSGYVTARPCGSADGGSSVVNVERREIRSNLAVVPTAADGTVCLTVSTPMHLVVDQVGSMVPGSGSFVSAQTRLYLDFGLLGLLAELLGEPVDESDDGYVVHEIAVGDTGLVSTEATSVVLDVLVDSDAAAYAVAYSCDGPVPATSTLNVNAPRRNGPSTMTSEGTAIVELGPSRSVCLRTPASSEVVVYLEGWFA